MGYDFNNIIPLEDRRYILKTRDGDYVERVEGVPHETVNLHFHFTRDKNKAKVFAFKDLWNPLAIRPVGIQFTQGFAGGKSERVV